MKFEIGIALTSALAASAAAIEKRATCSSYTIIDTRGTGEAQGPSAGFRTMNSRIMSQVSGGKEYDTVYAAGSSQNSAAGTADIVRKIQTTLASNPNECFILEGYSQGAAATVNAMPKLTGANFDAVKGVFLIGDPEHKSGLTCNVDNNGGTTTRNVNGLSTYQGSIPSNWIAKVLDVCIYVSALTISQALCLMLTNIQGDGVCDTTHGYGINSQHLQYPNDAPTQSLGTTYVTGRLQNA
jgi:hypothetical protein